MGENMHSPAPWVVQVGQRGSGPFDRLTVETGDKHWVLCTVNEAKFECAENARLISAAPDMLAALKAAAGYLTNASIDLTTGAPKKTALATIEGGLKLLHAAIAKAEGRS